MKVNRTQFLIIRVTEQEKESLVSSAQKAKVILSKFVRSVLGFK